MDKKFSSWMNRHMPTRRRLIQLYAALLCNAHVKGFIEGDIFTGNTKGVCVPGLNCYSCPGAIGACPLGSLQNALAVSGKRAPWYILGILMLYGLILGRTICGWLCPLGFIQELLHKLPTPKIQKSKVTRVLSWLKYVVLGVCVIALPLILGFQGQTSPIFCKYICPAGTSEGAISLLSNPINSEKFSMLNGIFTQKFVILIVLAMLSVFVYRCFCRFLCPLGAIYSLFAKWNIIGVKVEREKCVHCGKCANMCKMDVRHVGDRECIHCGECISSCHVNAISFRCGKIKLLQSEEQFSEISAKSRFSTKRIIACILALLLLAGMLWYANRDSASLPETVPETVAENNSVQESQEDTGIVFSVPMYSNGGDYVLKDYRGKVVVINFWATWCAPCVKELPSFEKLQQEYGEKISVIAIHAKLTTEDVQSYIDSKGLQLSFAHDTDGSVLSMFGGSTQLPVTVIVDQNGEIVYNKTGSVTFEMLQSLIEPLLQ